MAHRSYLYNSAILPAIFIAVNLWYYFRMLQDLISSLFKLFTAVVILGLAVALFFIGIIALWYFLIIGLAIWIVRKLYRAFQNRHSGPVQAGDVEVIVHEEPTRPSKPRPGRVIEHE
jgi:hypothetical protein